MDAVKVNYIACFIQQEVFSGDSGAISTAIAKEVSEDAVCDAYSCLKDSLLPEITEPDLAVFLKSVVDEYIRAVLNSKEFPCFAATNLDQICKLKSSANADVYEKRLENLTDTVQTLLWK